MVQVGGLTPASKVWRKRIVTGATPADIGSAEADLDPSSERYAARFSGPAGEWMKARQTSALTELIAEIGEGRVLDVGGGHGQTARPLVEAGRDVTVFASSEAAYGQATKISSPLLAFAHGDLNDLPFPDQSFDVVISFRIMAHIGDWRRYLAGLCRVARRGVVVDFPIPGGVNALQPLLFGVKKRLEGDTRRFDVMTKSDVRDTLIAQGLAPAKPIGQFVLPMVLHRKLNAPAISGAMERSLRTVGLASAIGTPVVMAAKRG